MVISLLLAEKYVVFILPANYLTPDIVTGYVWRRSESMAGERIRRLPLAVGALWRELERVRSMKRRATLDRCG
jgi:hypothetical protein